MFDIAVGNVLPRMALPDGFWVDRFPLDMLRAERVFAVGRRPPPDLARVFGGRAIAVVDPMRSADTSYRTVGRASAFEVSVGDARVVVRDAEPRILGVRAPLGANQLAALADDPAIVVALDERRLRAWLDAERDAGVYRWSVADPSDPSRYRRTHVPASPIRIHELPDDAQQAIRSTRFEARFARTSELFLEDQFVDADRTVLLRPPTTEPRTRDSARAPRERNVALGLALGVATVAHALLAWLLR